MSQKLDVGGTLSQIFSTYGAQAGVLLPVAFALFVVVAIVNAIISGSLILVPLGLAVGIVAGTLYQGMVVGLVRDVQDGRRDSSVQDLIDATWPVVLPLIGAGIFAGICIGLGFLLFVIPGLVLVTLWAVIAPVIVVERSGVFAAFGRSRAMVRGNAWQVFGVIFVVFIITAIASLVLGAIGAAISGGLGMQIVVNLIASTLTAPIAALAAATIYFRLLALKGDAVAAGAPQPPAPPVPPAGAAPA